MTGEQICRDLLEGNAELSTRRNALKLKKAQLLGSTRILDQLKSEFDRNNAGDSDNDLEDFNAAANSPNRVNGFHSFHGSNSLNGRDYAESPTISGSLSQSSRF